MAEDTVSVQVTLPQLLDLALRTPEVGSVNFNILHNFLFILLNQLNLMNKNVEYRDTDANRIKSVLGLVNTEPCSELHAYSITDSANITMDAIDAFDNLTSTSSPLFNREHTEPSVRSFSIAPPVMPTNVPSRASVALSPVVSSFTALDLPEEITRLNNRMTEFEVNLSNLNDEIADLQKNSEEEQRSKSASSIFSGEIEFLDESLQPIAERKLSEQVIRFSEPLITSPKIDPRNKSQSLFIPKRQSSSISRRRSVAVHPDLNELKADVVDLQIQMSEVKNIIETRQPQMYQEMLARHFSAARLVKGIIDDRVFSRINDQEAETSGYTYHTVHNDENCCDVDRFSESRIPELTVQHSLSSEQEINSEINDVRSGSRIETEVLDRIQNIEAIHNESIRNFEFRVVQLETEMKVLNEIISNMQTGKNNYTREIQELNSNMGDIRGNIERINQTAMRLNEEMNNHDLYTNIFKEQIEILKNMKADKEDLEDALVDKADARTVNKKVSVERFNIICEDLKQRIDDAKAKSVEEGNIWQQSLDAVQQEIDNKLDRVEMPAFTEFFNSRLQVLQDKMKELTKQKRENEAAAAKQILTGLQCVSCDRDVVMRMDQGPHHQYVAVPPSQSIKPYLTFRLDQIRKQKKMAMNKTTGDYYCSRCCGESRAMTRSQQRTLRSSNISAEWESAPVNPVHETVRGTDGQFYYSAPRPPGTTINKSSEAYGPSNIKSCCGIQDPNPSNHQNPQNKANQAKESTIQRHSTQKDKKDKSN